MSADEGVTVAAHGYMVGHRTGRCTGVAQLDGDAGWQVWHGGIIVADGLTAEEAQDKLRTLPVPAVTTHYGEDPR